MRISPLNKGKVDHLPARVCATAYEMCPQISRLTILDIYLLAVGLPYLHPLLSSKHKNNHSPLKFNLTFSHSNESLHRNQSNLATTRPNPNQSPDDNETNLIQKLSRANLPLDKIFLDPNKSRNSSESSALKSKNARQRARKYLREPRSRRKIKCIRENARIIAPWQRSRDGLTLRPVSWHASPVFWGVMHARADSHPECSRVHELTSKSVTPYGYEWFRGWVWVRTVSLGRIWRVFGF